MTAIDPEGLFFDRGEDAAAAGLLALMTSISEGEWCAGWLRDIEFDLWERAQSATGPGQDPRTGERQSYLLKLLAEECGGWWRWDDAAGAPVFVTDDAWRALVRRRNGEPGTA
jgi:hypothetical protein